MPDLSRNMFLIARREYLEQIRGRAFRMSTIGLPLLFAVVVAIGYGSSMGIGAHKRIVVASSNALLANDVREHLIRQKGSSADVALVTPLSPEKRAELIGRIQSGALDGLLWIETPPGKPPAATYISKAAGDFMTGSRLRAALDDGIVEEKLTNGGVSPVEADALTRGARIETYQVKADGSVMKSNAEASFWKGYVMAFLLSLTTMLYGMNVARSVIQEKTSRIFEVMLSTVKPTDMLAGKLIGVGAVGLTQIAIWLLAAAAIMASPFAAGVLTGQFSVHFSWIEAVLFPVYFVLGYLLYSSLFAGLAATCETEQELQMYMPLAAAPTWLSFALIVVIMNDSNSPWAVAGSLFPATAPVVMFLRMATEIPPGWQIGLSIALLLVSIWAVLWFSSRLYRVGILMYGKRATLPELIRWLRYS